MTLLPMRTASRVPATEVTTTAAASGSSRTPVLSGLYDFTTWKYWVIRKMKPSSANSAIATAPQAAVKRGLRKRLTSIMGCADRVSATAIMASTATPPAMTAAVEAEPQPQRGASITPNTSMPIPAPDSDKATPVDRRRGRIARGRHGGRHAHRDNGGEQGHQHEDAAPPEALKQPATRDRADRHSALPAQAPHSPIARARSRRPVNTLVISDSVDG